MQQIVAIGYPPVGFAIRPALTNTKGRGALLRIPESNPRWALPPRPEPRPAKP